MKKTYHIHGMTCNGCRSHVENILSQVVGISAAAVNLEQAEVSIEMKSPMPLEIFQEALKNDGDRYSIHRDKVHAPVEKKTVKPKDSGTGIF